MGNFSLHGMFKKSFKIIYFFLISFLLVSCRASIGTVELPLDRFSYNETLQYSDMQQQLLNIVRLRYSDPPYFLSINSIVSQFEYTKSATASATVNSGYYFPPIPYVVPYVQPSVAFADRPTVTFTPLQGTDFVTRLMTPVDLSVLYMLLRAGWGISHTLRPIVEQMGPIDATKTASRVTSSRVPHYRTFKAITNALRKLQRVDALDISKGKVGNEFAIRLQVKSFATLSKEDIIALGKINITRDEPYVWLTKEPSDNPHELYTQTRTVLGILNYLSKGVDIPEEDIKMKRVAMTYYPNGQIFDWHAVTGKLFRVRVTKKPPKSDTLVAVKYHNKYFYISDYDFETKETLMLATIIMGIYEGKIEGFLPVFTVS